MKIKDEIKQFVKEFAKEFIKECDYKLLKKLASGEINLEEE